MILPNFIRLNLFMKPNINQYVNYLCKLSLLLKTFIFIVAFLVNFVFPTTVAAELKPFSEVQNIKTPDEFRCKWVQQYEKEQNFGLLSAYPLKNNKATAIRYIYNYGKYKESKEHKGAWANFVPEKVSQRLAAVDFLAKTFPPLLTPPSNSELRGKVVKSMEDLLVFESKATRKAKPEARKVIIGATIRIVLELCNRGKDSGLSYDVARWKRYFTEKQAKAYGINESVLKEESYQGVVDTINTRATLAALVSFEITGQGTLLQICKDSGMEKNVFINFINEIRDVVPDYGLSTDLNATKQQIETKETSNEALNNSAQEQRKSKIRHLLTSNRSLQIPTNLFEEEDQDLASPKIKERSQLRYNVRSSYGTFGGKVNPSEDDFNVNINIQQQAPHLGDPSWSYWGKYCCFVGCTFVSVGGVIFGLAYKNGWFHF